jgi:hypothetical protein
MAGQDAQEARHGERRDLTPPWFHNEAAENKPPTLWSLVYPKALVFDC